MEGGNWEGGRKQNNDPDQSTWEMGREEPKWGMNNSFISKKGMNETLYDS